MINLDLKAAETAQAILESIKPTVEDAKEAEDLITKTLGVVQENGPYAGILFLCSKTGNEKDTPSLVRRRLLELAENLGVHNLAASGDSRRILKSVIEQICLDTNVLLLVKQSWEQALIYARHSAKALKAQVGAGS